MYILAGKLQGTFAQRMKRIFVVFPSIFYSLYPDIFQTIRVKLINHSRDGVRILTSKFEKSMIQPTLNTQSVLCMSAKALIQSRRFG